MTASADGIAGNALARIASTGVALTLVVLGISVWLRLNTTLDAAGNAVSSLATGSEAILRAVHRISASVVGVIALVAAFLAVRNRRRARGLPGAAALVIAMTLALAAAGRFTAGYRLPGITIVNVAAGIALAVGFLWIRLGMAGGASPRYVPGARPRSGVAVAALFMAFVHAALGAAASAHTLHRAAISLEPWHIGTGFVVSAICIVAAARNGAPARGARIALAWLVLTQLGTGLWVAGHGEAAAPAIAWLHAALAAAIVLLLVHVVVRSQPRSPASS